MITRALYVAAWAIALPAALVRLAWRSRWQAGYRANMGERLGRYPTSVESGAPLIWVHAVSVGETRAAAPLIEALLAKYPDHRFLLTHMTPTGRATGEALFGDRVERAWLPYDMPFAVRGFLDRYRPAAGILLETEVWPVLLEECRRRGIPTLLANARLSERSARRYARWPALAAWAFGNITRVAAQADEDAGRLGALGARRVEVTGNVKFDVPVDPVLVQRGRSLREAFGAPPVWIAGSTREGEEAALLDALPAHGPARLLLVPRHPQRFEAVAQLARDKRLSLAARSTNFEGARSARVLLGDSMGEMFAYYAAADVAIMGGSLLPFGGQNLIEAMAVGVPVVVGPHTYNFDEATRGAIAAGAAVRVKDAAEALECATAIAADAPRREAMSRAALAFVGQHRGAVQRLAAAVQAMLDEAASPSGRG